MTNLFNCEELAKELHDPENVIYRAYKDNKSYGITKDNLLMTGLILRQVCKGDGYDTLNEEFSEMETNAKIILPPEGLEEGAYYIATTVNIQTDWELQIPVDWDIKIIKVC